MDAVQGPFGLWLVRVAQQQGEQRDLLNFTRRFAQGWEGTDHAVKWQHPAPEALKERS